MVSYALIKFKISNDFYEWEQAFYTHQPMDNLFAEAGEEVTKSGHMLESTEVTMLTTRLPPVD